MGIMAATRCSPTFSRISSALPLAPPLRFASPLPLCFIRSNHSHRFSSFDEPDVPHGTQQQWKMPGRQKPALSIAEVKADLAETEWTISPNLAGIQRRYVFRNFEDAFEYMKLVVKRCRGAARHWPMSSNWGNRLFMRWSSYNNTCITRTDMQLSRFCDRLYDEKFAAQVSEPESPSMQIPDDLDWADDRQILYGKDAFYGTKDQLSLWDWLPHVKSTAQKENAYPLWGISHSRLVWTSLLWDGKTGTPKAMTREDKSRWRPGAPIRKIKGTHYWLSNLADHASQRWMPNSWVEKSEDPKQLPLRFSMARSNESLKRKREKEEEKEEPSQDGNLQPKGPRPRTRNVRIYVD
ncbi:hypothetical protein HDK77DRAFT_160223 [Phyllosticta capitalensis]|uniref:4a-hydroxytetrahydrobiopterin dehydratase n=1 Tax=Phyllosticta capitalensis TaxID=121624 RepID=A0ABR1YTX5_9PEZI